MDNSRGFRSGGGGGGGGGGRMSSCSVDPRQVDPLVVGRVIGDVVDMFVPSVSISVSYNSKHLTNGCDMKPSMACDRPRVHISGNPDHFYTLVMTDPDAPSPSEPSMREWIHWIVVDIPGGNDASQGKEMVEYMGPKPPVGIHRYVMVVFKQKSKLGGMDGVIIETRAHFNTRNFARHLDLGIPVATFYFNSQKEPASKRR